MIRLNEKHPAALLVALPVAGMALAALIGYAVAWQVCRRIGIC